MTFKETTERIKVLKIIRPDRSFNVRSKQDIFSVRAAQADPFSWRIFFQSGARLALPFALVLFAVLSLFASVLTVQHSSPLSTLESLDMAALQAEAEAIDIHIHLANVAYRDTPLMAIASNPEANTPSPVAIRTLSQTQAPSSSSPLTAAEEAPATSSPSDEEDDIAIEELLEALSE
jgi:hypothetical protein